MKQEAEQYMYQSMRVLPAIYKTICNILPSWLNPRTDKINGVDFDKTHKLAIIF